MMLAGLVSVLAYFWWGFNKENGYFYYYKNRIIILFFVDMIALLATIYFLTNPLGINQLISDNIGVSELVTSLSLMGLYRILDNILIPLITIPFLILSLLLLVTKIISDIVRMAKGGWLDSIVQGYGLLYVIVSGLINLIRRNTGKKRRRAN